MVLLAYLVLGVVAGLLAGVFGIGGGVVIVPTLIFAFKLQGFAPTSLSHLAVGTSLATIVVTSVSSVRAHHQARAVDWPLFRLLAPGIVVGSMAGVLLAAGLSGFVLQLAIGVFLLLVALQMALDWQPAPQRQLPGGKVMVTAGGVIGALSAVFGIGGGSLTVPFLTGCNLPVKRAVATSAACGLPLALAGAAVNMLVGRGAQDLPDWSTGYVYWPAFFGIAVTSVVSARYGARLAHRLPAAVLKRAFALLLLLVGCRLIYDAWS